MKTVSTKQLEKMATDGIDVRDETGRRHRAPKKVVEKPQNSREFDILTAQVAEIAKRSEAATAAAVDIMKQALAALHKKPDVIDIKPEIKVNFPEQKPPKGWKFDFFCKDGKIEGAYATRID